MGKGDRPFEPLAVFRQIRASSLSSTDRLVLVFYVLRCDSETGRTFVGANTIALDSGAAVKTVKRSRARLRTRGILEVTATRGGGRATDHHLLHADRIPVREEGKGSESPHDGDRESPSTDEEGDSPSLNTDSVGTDDPHERDSLSPGRGQRVPLSAHDLPSDLPSGSKPPSPSGAPELFDDAPPERAKTKAEVLDDQVRLVCSEWWRLWNERAPWVPGKTSGSRVRTGKAAGAPRTEELTADDRDAIRKALTGKGKRTTEELCLLARWAFCATEFSAAVLRGEAKAGQAENEHLSAVTVYRKTKIPAKLTRARRWESSGSPAGPGIPQGSTGYESLEDLANQARGPVIDVTGEPVGHPAWRRS